MSEQQYEIKPDCVRVTSTWKGLLVESDTFELGQYDGQVVRRVEGGEWLTGGLDDIPAGLTIDDLPVIDEEGA